MFKLFTKENLLWAIGSAILLMMLIAIGTYTFTSGKTAKVSSKEFECTATSAVGIEPRCDQYTRVRSTQVH